MTPRSVLLDTAPLIGLINVRDQAHERARAVFGKLSRERRQPHIPFPVAVELHRFLLFQKPPQIEKALRTLQALLQAYPLVMPVEADVETALEQMSRYPDQKISLVDATLVSMSQRTGLPVVTFDERHFRLLGAELFV